MRKIPVKYIETPEIKIKIREGGRKGGLAKVPKGFAMMDEVRRKKIAKDAALKRWSKKDAE